MLSCLSVFIIVFFECFFFFLLNMPCVEIWVRVIYTGEVGKWACLVLCVLGWKNRFGWDSHLHLQWIIVFWMCVFILSVFWGFIVLLIPVLWSFTLQGWKADISCLWSVFFLFSFFIWVIHIYDFTWTFRLQHCEIKTFVRVWWLCGIIEDFGLLPRDTKLAGACMWQTLA